MGFSINSFRVSALTYLPEEHLELLDPLAPRPLQLLGIVELVLSLPPVKLLSRHSGLLGAVIAAYGPGDNAAEDRYQLGSLSSNSFSSPSRLLVFTLALVSGAHQIRASRVSTPIRICPSTLSDTVA